MAKASELTKLPVAIPHRRVVVETRVEQVDETAPISTVDARGVAEFDPVPVATGKKITELKGLDVGRIKGTPIYPGINETSADWARTRVLTQTLLSITKGSRETRSIDSVRAGLEGALKGHGFSASAGEVDRLLKRMVAEGVLDRKGDSVSLAADARVIATQAQAAAFIRSELVAGLKCVNADPLARDLFRRVLVDYAQATELWPLDPVESKGGLFKAIAKMSEPDRTALMQFIDSEPDLLRLEAIDDVRLMLDPLNPRPDWAERNIPNLMGRTIVMASIEDDLEVGGGLGRVFGYESERMNRLLTTGAQTLAPQDKPSFTTISPMYDFRFIRGGAAVPLDYAQKGVKDLQVVRRYDQIDLEDAGNARAEILTGRTDDGIQRIFVHDPDGVQTTALYQYDRAARAPDGREVRDGDWEDAVDFFGSAAAGYLREVANAKLAELGDAYRGMVVQGNDGQCSLAIGYLSNDRVIEDGGVDKIYLTSKTHTINNRGPDVVAGWNLPPRMNELATRIDSRDPTSLMLRSGTPGSNGRPIAQAVSSVHAAQMRGIDPGVDMYASTNGTRVEEFQRRFLTVLPEAERPASPAEATAEQLTRARVLGKERLARELNDLLPADQRMSDDEIAQFTEQALVVFSGRGVEEKVGGGEDQIFNDLALQQRGDRDSPRNIEQVLKDGHNFVLYLNVQAFQRSEDIFNGFVALQNEYFAARPAWAAEATAAGRRPPGRLIVRRDFGPEEQARLHSGGDVSVQVSTTEKQRWSAGVPVKTGANEATEVPDLICGNMKLTVPEVHGGLNTLTELFNSNDPTQGGILVPDEYSAKGFLAALRRGLDELVNRPADAATRRQAIFREVRATDAAATAAADLRLFNKIVPA